MKQNTTTYMAIATAAVLLCGCGSSTKSGGSTTKAPEKITPVSVTPGQEADLFPAQKDNTWVFESTASQGNAVKTTEVTFKIASIEDTPDGKLIHIEVSSNGQVADKITWRLGPNGLYDYQGSYRKTADDPLTPIKYEPAVPIIPFPVKENSEVDVSSTGTRPLTLPGPFKSKISVLGPQEVDTATGRMSAMCTEQRSQYQNGDIQFLTVSTAYWVPKVGLVRYVQDITVRNKAGNTQTVSSVLRLKSHQP